MQKMALTQEVSFPDEQITFWQHQLDKLEISITGFHYANYLHGPAILVFSEIQSIICMAYIDCEWKELQRIEPLKDICEFYFSFGGHYSLKGFSKMSGQWVSIGINAKHGYIHW